MRLLYLGSTDVPQPKARAIQIVSTCHALARAGVDVSLVVGRRGRADPTRALGLYGLTPHPRLRLVSLPIFRIPAAAPAPVLRHYTRLWQLSYLAGLAAALPRELLCRRPDVVYARDLRTSLLVSAAARSVGARTCFEVHGLPSFEVSGGAGRATLSPRHAARLRRLEERVFRRASHVVTITECARQLLLGEFGLAPAKVRAIPDATLAPVVFERARESPNGRAPGGPLPAVYYVGQLYPWKGADLVIETAALVRKARFVVVGGLPGRRGRDPSVDALAERARRLGAAERVELRGYVPYAGVPSVLADADVAVVPLPDEPVARIFTSPLKLFDYMAAGVPIVASDLPAVREVLRDGDNALLATPGDPVAFAGAIERVLRDPSLARRLAERARQDAARYTWDERAARILEFLQAEAGAGA